MRRSYSRRDVDDPNKLLLASCLKAYYSLFVRPTWTTLLLRLASIGKLYAHFKSTTAIYNETLKFNSIFAADLSA